MSLGSQPGVTSKDETILRWRTRPAPYVGTALAFLAAVAGTAMAGLLGSHAYIAAVVAGALALPAWRAVRVLRGPSAFRLTARSLELGEREPESLALDRIAGVHPHATGLPSLFGAVIAVTTDEGRTVVLPRFATRDPRSIHGEVLRGVGAAQEESHSARSEPGAWPRYARAPGEIMENFRDYRSHRPEGAALLFRAPVRKFSGHARSVRGFLFSLALTAAFVAVVAWALASDRAGREFAEGMTAAAIILGIVFLLSLAVRARLKGQDWLLVHEEGVAMVGRTLTGELDWEEVADITKLRRGKGMTVTGSVAPTSTGLNFFIRTLDGANISVSDRYDAPIAVVEKAVRSLRGKGDAEGTAGTGMHM